MLTWALVHVSGVHASVAGVLPGPRHPGHPHVLRVQSQDGHEPGPGVRIHPKAQHTALNDGYRRLFPAGAPRPQPCSSRQRRSSSQRCPDGVFHWGGAYWPAAWFWVSSVNCCNCRTGCRI
ncbi:MAG: hypothetical protein ABWY04_21870 [Arthrobacter sp.]